MEINKKETNKQKRGKKKLNKPEKGRIIIKNAGSIFERLDF